jgi:cytidine deaminase
VEGVRPADRELYDQAVAVAANAYAPYSEFFVGAAIRARDGRVFLGVNVENAAYPLGVCAEKSALTAAVTAGCRPGDFEAVGITASPCGGCRQWLVEMGIERVVYAREGGEVIVATPAELLPDTFEL